MITAKEARKLQSFGGVLKLLEDANKSIIEAAKRGVSSVNVDCEHKDLTRLAVTSILEDEGFEVEYLEFASFRGNSYLKISW